MALIPWRSKQRQAELTEPSPIAALRDEMDRLFESFLREPLGMVEWPFAGRGRWMPAVDVDEGPDEITVRAEIPGIDPKDLDVTVVGNQLVLSGEKKQSTEQSGRDFYQSEIRFGSFRRSLPLPEGVDTENVDAQYANGVLTLRMKKTEAAAAKRIPIKGTGSA